MTDSSLSNLFLTVVTMAGAVGISFWGAFIIWTYKDMSARSRDPLAPIAASVMVAVLFVFGVVIYVMLRPRETLADAYERSLEEEALLQEIEEKPACPGCGRSVKHDWQVCPYCHTKLKKDCVACSNLLELSWNICPHCATPQVGYENAGKLDGGYQQSSQAQQLPASPYQVNDAPPYQAQQSQESGVEWVDENQSY